MGVYSISQTHRSSFSTLPCGRLLCGQRACLSRTLYRQLNNTEKRAKSKELNILSQVITIINQYFPELIEKFEGLTDIRHQSYVTYKMKVIFMVRLLALMCEIKSMHGLTRELNTEEAIKNIAQICGLELDEIPHCDTINDVFKNVNIDEIDFVSGGERRDWFLQRFIVR